MKWEFGNLLLSIRVAINISNFLILEAVFL